jgi:raffinose/stachyose/melibiose transport system permease protein
MSSSTQTKRSPLLGYRNTRNLEKWLAIALFLIPAAAIYIWLVILPVIKAAQFSLYQWNGLGPMVDFVGLDNFEAIFSDKIFREALGNNLFILVLSLAIQLPVALGLAVMLQRRLIGRAAFRTIFFMPFVVSEVITGLIFRFIFRTTAQGGLINILLDAVGIDGPAWMGEPDVVMWAIFVTLSWKFFGYHMVLYLAGLQGIPAELEEAAMIDGAGGWQVFRYVTLPLLGPTIRLTIFFSVVGSLQVFDLVWAMTRGGPVFASETMATYMYRAGFLKQQVGYGSALAIIIFVLCFGFSILWQRFAMRRDLEGAY